MVMACRAHKHTHAAVVLQTGVVCDLIESHHPTTTCTVSTIAHISPSTDCLKPDCSFHSPLCRFERNHSSSRRLQIVSSPTACSHPRCFECNHSSITDYRLSQAWLLVPVLAVSSTTAHLAVYGFSRARPLIPILTVLSAITCLSLSMDCLKPDRSLCTILSTTAPTSFKDSVEIHVRPFHPSTLVQSVVSISVSKSHSVWFRHFISVVLILVQAVE
ncbi:hypothetical protein L210DRAFT_988859 [Boletus edulis BED1]|uniref:Uncharacterized protein n=1 Tax=Boletus edulis BED1 TaxID=1328754 RepID=A0AAD4C793_BOLED|nr:hypothetical protein L210DRAFT_988859 [Boletus edulis BED1]